MNVEEMMRSIMSEEIRTLEAQMEQRFSSQIHQATTSTPGFDDLARGVRETPLTKCITNAITPKIGSISFPSLIGAALRWFCNLPPESIDSFDELSLEFMRSYSVHIQSGKTTKDLWVVQGPHESLRAYIKCFSKAISEISGLDDGTAREALKKGLRHKSLFKNKICARYPHTIQDAMHRAKGFIELEEENERENLSRKCYSNAAAILTAAILTASYSRSRQEVPAGIIAVRRIQLIFCGDQFSTSAGSHMSFDLCPKGLVHLEKQPH
ncbi:hypothetical protein TIFTF001_028110 [Ficus carica]|uniref:Retrotransposon gag domain-containing protein n=1 Tax=Ficus carica TaxID=3494 RepID=A0AA88DPH3_FICCA|nr:hypothetical protein TIFTF001_028110 [Ficus carica]